MKTTHFAKAERASEWALQEQLNVISRHPVVDGLLETVSGLMAILNENRQIIATNEALLQLLGIESLNEIIGFRPGEAFHCVYASDMEAGCGTSKFCSTCGAAIAIVSSLGQDKPVERKCSLKVNKNGREEDMFFSIRSCPITIEGQKYLILFLQDISRQQNWAYVERMFFHDINNYLNGLVGSSEILAGQKAGDPDQLAATIHKMALCLAQEVRIQQNLSRLGGQDLQTLVSEFSLQELSDQLKSFFRNHQAAQGKTLAFDGINLKQTIKTDFSLLMRVLGNMITNGLEASESGELIRFKIESEPGKIVFSVWNKTSIPEETALRIFQRNFSTKNEFGRGLGTYSMKFFGEKFLGGKVSFTSAPGDGTVFYFAITV